MIQFSKDQLAINVAKDVLDAVGGSDNYQNSVGGFVTVNFCNFIKFLEIWDNQVKRDKIRLLGTEFLIQNDSYTDLVCVIDSSAYLFNHCGKRINFGYVYNDKLSCEVRYQFLRWLEKIIN